MKEAPERVPNRNGLRYSAADKLKAVKLYLEEGYQVMICWRYIGQSYWDRSIYRFSFSFCFRSIQATKVNSRYWDRSSFHFEAKNLLLPQWESAGRASDVFGANCSNQYIPQHRHPTLLLSHKDYETVLHVSYKRKKIPLQHCPEACPDLKMRLPPKTGQLDLV